MSGFIRVPRSLFSQVASLSLSLWLTVAMLVPGNAQAVDMTAPLPDAAMQQRYEGLIHELRCMQCQNESLADSNVSLAADLRAQVRDMIAAGKSDAEVRDYLVARYGEFILFRPRVSLRNIWLWSAPMVLLLAGAAVAAQVIKRRAALLPDDVDKVDDPRA